MAFEIHQEPQVHGSEEQRVLLQVEHLKRTVTSPHDLVRHIIDLYGAEFVKANECIAALHKRVQEKEQANDELFRIKQRTVIANRELRQTNNELGHVLRRFVDELPTKRDWLDPDLEKVARLLLKGQRVLPAITDELRNAAARLTSEATDTSGFAQDLILLLNFVEEYDFKTHSKNEPSFNQELPPGEHP